MSLVQTVKLGPSVPRTLPRWNPLSVEINDACGSNATLRLEAVCVLPIKQAQAVFDDLREAMVSTYGGIDVRMNYTRHELCDGTTAVEYRGRTARKAGERG